jgi:hypothetical protein
MKSVYRLTVATLLCAMPLPALAAPIETVLYKNPHCTCCDGYAYFLRKEGFDVKVKPTNDLAEISRDAGVPEKLQGCHTMFVEGYVVDGLVPIDIVKKLLAERPAIRGITLPGMPAGAIGMLNDKKEPFTVYAIAKDGSPPTVYAVE